jgi:hypothetical protein
MRNTNKGEVEIVVSSPKIVALTPLASSAVAICLYSQRQNPNPMQNQISKARRWTSYVMSGMVILFMLMDSIMKFVMPPEVIEGTVALGFSEEHIPVLGALGLISTLLYVFPRTSMLGAILLTAYFGGAVATHVRLNNPLFTHTLFTVYFGILIWGGLWLRNTKLQEMLPLRRAG